MEKKIAALKAAYQAKDNAKIRARAAAVVAHDRKHPFSSLPYGEIVELAKRIEGLPADRF